MRPEKLEKVTAVSYVINNQVYSFENIDSDNQLRIDTELKQQERRAENEIRRLQRENFPNENGYYISAGIVYKVYFTSTLVKKITGDEAKNIKRLVKKELDKREQPITLRGMTKVSTPIDELGYI